MAMPATSWRNFFVFLLNGIIGLSIVFSIAIPFAEAAPVADTSRARPAFESMSGISVLNPAYTLLRGIPDGWRCGQFSQSESGCYDTTNPTGSWVYLTCRSETVTPRADMPDISYTTSECSMWRGSGSQSIDRETLTQLDSPGSMSWEVPTINSDGTVEVEEGRAGAADIVASIFAGAGNWISGILIEAVALIIWFFSEILVWMLNGLLALVALFFDYVVSEFVIEMGKYITADSSGAVRDAWIIIRDLANIGIIAGMVATAIGTIVGVGNYSISKTLARLILAALLVNFSYFFAGAIIDFSNFTAKAAYEAVIKKAGCETDSSCGIASRTGKLINFTGINERVQEIAVGDDEMTAQGAERSGETRVGRETYTTDNAFIPSRQATFNVMLIIFILVTMFVFLSAISLLIARFVALIFLLITSPIGIAGWSVPLLKSYSDEWWKALSSQAMFAPVYFLLAGISLNMLDAFAGQLNSDPVGLSLTSFALTRSLEGMIPIIAVFTVAIGFMWAALSTAKKMAAASERFKELYDGVQKYLTKPGTYLGGMVLRDTVGRAADYARLKLPGFTNRVSEWSKGKGMTQSIGRAVGKYTGLGGFVKMGGRALDRAAQKGFEKIADQKFFGAEGYKKLYDEKEKRKIDLVAKKEALENEDDFDGRKAKRELLEKERKLKEEQKRTSAAIAELEKVSGRTPAQDASLASLREKREKERAELAEINKFKENRKRHPKDGVTKEHGELVESSRLNQLHADRQNVIGQGKLSPEEVKRLEEKEKNKTLTAAEGNRLRLHREHGGDTAKLDAEIAEEEEFEQQKDKYGWGGAQGRIRRGKAKQDRAVAAGERIENFNERAHASGLEKIAAAAAKAAFSEPDFSAWQALERQAAANPGAFSETDPGKKGALQVRLEKFREQAENASRMSPGDEKSYLEALQTPPSERTPDQVALVTDPNRKLTSAEAKASAYYREQKTAITEDTNTKLDADIRRRTAGTLTDKKRLAEMEVLENRRRVAGVVSNDGKTIIKKGDGFSEGAVENFHAFRIRQESRNSAVQRKLQEKFNDETGQVEFELEDDYGYKYRLETGDATLQLRNAMGDARTLVGKLGVDYIKGEYRKDPKSILKYATALNDEDWAKIASDHSINEEIRNEMQVTRIRRFTDGFIKLQQDIVDGKVAWGSDEFNRRKNDLFNQQTKYIPNSEMLAALQTNAVIGELHNKKTGATMHVRIKDLNTDTGEEGVGNLRRLFWHSTSSTMFADAKKTNVFGRELSAEMARDKRGGEDGTDRMRDIDHMMYDMMGLSDDKNYMQQTAGKVQMYAKARADKATKNILVEAENKINAYNDGESTQTTNDYIATQRARRLAQLNVDAQAGRGIFQDVLQTAVATNNLKSVRASIAQKLNIPAADIPEQDVISYAKLEAVRKVKAEVMSDPRSDEQIISEMGLDEGQKLVDQRLFFEMQEENKINARNRAKGWTEDEAAGAWNERSMHSPIIAETIQQSQIPALLSGKDPVDAERFWESYYLTRGSEEITAARNSQAIQSVIVYPTKSQLRAINIRRLANNQDILVGLPTSD
ncbi:hypothetical protein K2P56_04005 [Patescibacteria group bacterium]|nr:hypothetical protein [Patescibacteria group bacterium]